MLYRRCYIHTTSHLRMFRKKQISEVSQRNLSLFFMLFSEITNFQNSHLLRKDKTKTVSLKKVFRYVNLFGEGAGEW